MALAVVRYSRKKHGPVSFGGRRLSAVKTRGLLAVVHFSQHDEHCSTSQLLLRLLAHVQNLEDKRTTVPCRRSVVWCNRATKPAPSCLFLPDLFAKRLYPIEKWTENVFILDEPSKGLEANRKMAPGESLL